MEQPIRVNICWEKYLIKTYKHYVVHVGFGQDRKCVLLLHYNHILFVMFG